MAKKKKKTVWHKKKGKFISSSSLKPHGKTPQDNGKPTSAHDMKKNRRKEFAKNLLSQIKKAVEESSS